MFGCLLLFCAKICGTSFVEFPVVRENGDGDFSSAGDVGWRNAVEGDVFAAFGIGEGIGEREVVGIDGRSVFGEASGDGSCGVPVVGGIVCEVRDSGEWALFFAKPAMEVEVGEVELRDRIADGAADGERGSNGGFGVGVVEVVIDDVVSVIGAIFDDDGNVDEVDVSIPVCFVVLVRRQETAYIRCGLRP